MASTPLQEMNSFPENPRSITPCPDTAQNGGSPNSRQACGKKVAIEHKLAPIEPADSKLEITSKNSKEDIATRKPAESRKKLPSYPYEDMSTRIRIIVNDAKDFQVQKELLCKHSVLFKDIFSEDTDAGFNHPVNITHVDADIFASFVGYLQYEDVYLATGIPIIVHQKADGPSHAKRQSYFLHLAKCYVLGWDLKAHDFCNAIMSVLVDISTKANGLGYIAGATSEIREYVASQAYSTPLHNLLDDNHTGFAKDRQRLAKFVKMAKPEDVGFLDFLECISKVEMTGKERTLSFPWERHICYYHVHPGQKEGYCCTKSNDVVQEGKRTTRKRKKDKEECKPTVDLQIPKKRKLAKLRPSK